MIIRPRLPKTADELATARKQKNYERREAGRLAREKRTRKP